MLLHVFTDTNNTSVMLYLVFFPHSADEAEDLSSSTATLTKSNPTNRRDPLIVGATIFISLFIVAIVSIALVFRFPQHTQTWADVLGTIAGVLAAIQYVPQIYYTWVLGDMKSLSVLTLIIQAPGAFVFALSLGLRVGVKGWSTWLVYIVTGALQFVLLAMAIKYWSAERLQRREAAAGQRHEGRFHDRAGSSSRVDINGTSGEADERTALLQADKSKQQTRT